MATYSEKLQHPLWQRRRANILERDDFKCRCCGSADDQVHAHHIFYRKGADPWDAADDELVTLCDNCHSLEHEYGDEAWRYLKVTMIELGAYHDAIRWIADGFAKQKIAKHEWPAMARCIRLVLELRDKKKLDLLEVGDILDDSVIDRSAGKNDGRDDEGYGKWVDAGMPELER